MGVSHLASHRLGDFKVRSIRNVAIFMMPLSIPVYDEKARVLSLHSS
jgi:hypothetical protein